MLKNIPTVLSPDLVHTLMSMGHGDTIVIADGNFPANSVAKANSAVFVPAYGLGVSEILDAVLRLLPLDQYDIENAVQVMQVVPNDSNSEKFPPIWHDFQSTIKKHEGSFQLKEVERFEFYERAKKAFAVVATSETAIYANIILKKGVVSPSSSSQ
jgi:L-fucose mutarotase